MDDVIRVELPLRAPSAILSNSLVVIPGQTIFFNSSSARATMLQEDFIFSISFRDFIIIICNILKPGTY